MAAGYADSSAPPEPSEAFCPSVAKILAAGQKGEILDAAPVYGRCRAVNIPGKGRGLVAFDETPIGGLLLLEPALATADTYSDLAIELRRLVEKPLQDDENGRDDVLLDKLLSLCARGEQPTSVPEVAPETAAACMRLAAPAADASARARALQRFAKAEDGEALQEQFTLIAQSNAFRSAPDPLGALAWHALEPKEQRAIAEQDPGKMPNPRLSLFMRAALINHSEAPNATWLVAGNLISVRASRLIRAGEEVLLSYWPDIDAADALSRGLFEGFGFSSETAGLAPEFELNAEQQAALERLKQAPFHAAQRLGAGAGGGDVGTLFGDTATALTAEITEAEKILSKQLAAFLEPRFIQAQLTLQQGALLTAQGDAKRGDSLRKLGLLRMTSALDNYTAPWGKRILLRMLFGLKGALRPSPAALLSDGQNPGADAQGDFAVQLAKQARPTVDELRPQLEQAVGIVFGDKALLNAILSKCGVADSE